MFELVVWNVAHGSAAHLHTPDGRVVVLDAGRSGDFSPAAHLLARRTAIYGTPIVDRLIISHPHQDHVADLPAYGYHMPPRVFVRNRALEPGLVYPKGDAATASSALQWYHYLDLQWTAPVPLLSAVVPPTPEYGGVEIVTFCNAPAQVRALGVEPSLNDLSVVTCVRYAGMSVVLPGDVEPLGQQLLLGQPGVRAALGAGSTRVLVAPHHGRRSGIAAGDVVYPAFVEAVRPHLVLMSDAWGCEHTCPELYEPAASRYYVWSPDAPERSGVRRVVTTKTHQHIAVRHSGARAPVVCVG